MNANSVIYEMSVSKLQQENYTLNGINLFCLDLCEPIWETICMYVIVIFPMITLIVYILYMYNAWI